MFPAQPEPFLWPISRLPFKRLWLILAVCLLPACGRVRTPATGRVAAEVLNLLPKSERQVATVFRQADPEDIRGVIAAATRIDDLGHGAGSTLEDALRRPSDVLVVVGHNEGGVMITPEGQRQPLFEFASRCANAGKLCVFLSCNSAAVSRFGAIGSDYELDSSRTPALTQRILAVVETAPLATSTPVSESDTMVGRLQQIVDDERYRMTRYYLVPSAAGTAASGLVIIAVADVTQD